MLSRTVIPENARIPERRPDEPKTVRSEHLVPRRLIPAGATVAALEGAREDVGSSLAASKRRLMVPKRLIPAGAQIGEASQVAAGTLAARPDVFSEAILNDASLDHRRTAADWLVSAAVHAAIVATIMAVPLFYTQVIDLNKFQTTYLAAPPIPAAPPPPLSVAAVAPRPPARKITPALTAKLAMPVAVPKAVLMTHDAPAAPRKSSPASPVESRVEFQAARPVAFSAARISARLRLLPSLRLQLPQRWWQCQPGRSRLGET